MSSLTIGEVLNRLKDDFEDVTISKIRFLEAEGLINPDRTGSGYRKFTDADIDRLRYILRAQRDRYLPLKVIKDELDRIDAGLPVAPTPTAPDPEEVAGLLGDGDDAPAPAEHDTAPTDDAAAPVTGGAPTDVQLSLRELADACGLEPVQLTELRDHGLLRGEDRFDGDDLRVAKLAAGLLQSGLEPRHLRMYRQFADREGALYQQLVTPLLRQRNPDSRRAASEQLDELASLGGRLHRAILSRELRELLRS